MQDERELLERFLKKGASSGAPSSSEKDEKEELEAFLSGGKAAPSPTPTPTPLPRPRTSTPAYIPPTERQEFGRRPLDLDTSLKQSHQRNVGRLLASEAELTRRSRTLRPDFRQPASIDEANQRISDLVADPAKMAALPPEQRQFLQGTLEYERRNLQIPTRPGPKRVAPTPAAKPFTMRRPADFDATAADRNILLTAADPAKLAALSPESRRAIENTAALIVRRDQEEQFQGRINQLVAERAAEKAAAPSYPVQLLNRFMRGATGTATSTIRGASLLHPELEADLRRKGILQTPEEGADFLRRILPVDPTDESLLSKGVEAAGSAVPFALGSAASGAAGLPSWLAPAVLGAATNAEQTYDEAIAAGQDPEAAKRAAIGGALIGLTEAAGVGRFGGKAEGVVGAARRGALRELGATAAKEFGEEAFQEAFSQALNNVNAKIVNGYDPKRAISENVFEAGLLGGFVGLGFGGGAHAAGVAAEGVGKRAERRAERAAGAEAVCAEPFTPLDLTPTTVGPTNLISLREAAKPEFRKRLEEATAPPAATPAEAVAAPQSAQPAAAPAEAAPADPLAAAVQQLMSLRRPTEAEAKKAEKEAEKQAKKEEKESEKQDKKAEREAEKQGKT